MCCLLCAPEWPWIVLIPSLRACSSEYQKKALVAVVPLAPFGSELCAGRGAGGRQG